MASKRVFVTGSADGLGLLAAKLLVEGGHRVVLHARSESRAADARRALPEAESVIVGDASKLADMRLIADWANAAGPFDAVIHNVGIYDPPHGATEDGLSPLFAVNVLAPYVLTALIEPRPARLVYLTSGMHTGGAIDPSRVDAKTRWSYSDTKLADVALAFAIARKWPDVRSNVVNPGWVPTKMGGRGAPDDLRLGAVTQAWLAVSEDAAAKVTGEYFFHQKREEAAPAARTERVQDAVVKYCGKVSGIEMGEG